MGSSNYTDFDIYSIFKYDDAKKYFERYIYYYYHFYYS